MTTDSATTRNLQREFEQAGFAVTSPRPAVLELRKYAFTCNLEWKEGAWTHSGPPWYETQGILCELEDRGYQKFWFSKTDGRRFPIRKVELEKLARFDAEVSYLLGLKRLYNESLGTTNARTVYDRLDGRPDQ